MVEFEEILEALRRAVVQNPTDRLEDLERGLNRVKEDLVREFDSVEYQDLLRIAIDAEKRRWQLLPDSLEKLPDSQDNGSTPLSVINQVLEAIGRYQEKWKSMLPLEVLRCVNTVMSSMIGIDDSELEHSFDARVALEIDGHTFKYYEGDLIAGSSMIIHEETLSNHVGELWTGPDGFVPVAQFYPYAMMEGGIERSEKKYRKWIFFKRDYDIKFTLKSSDSRTHFVAEKLQKLALADVPQIPREVTVHIAIEKSGSETDEEYIVRKERIIDYLRQHEGMSEHDWKIAFASMRVFTPAVNLQQLATTLAASSAYTASLPSFRGG